MGCGGGLRGREGCNCGRVIHDMLNHLYCIDILVDLS